MLSIIVPTTVVAAPTGNPWAQGRILVQPRAGLAESEFQRIVGRAGGRRGRKVRNLGIHIIDVAPQTEEAVVAALSRNPHIKFAELDHLVEFDQTIPNDPNFTSAWHLPMIKAPDAWDISLGEGVIVAVLDTGVDVFHLDLANNMLPGWNSASGNSDVTDINGHGTKVAGVVAAETDNALGVASVAWSARIMPVRITDRSDGWAYFSNIASGLTWAADHGARVANISYSVAGSATMQNAAQYMKNKGGVVVVAAGNSGSDPGYAASDTLVAVSATGSSDSRASWSSFGNYVDVAAPGVGIWTTARGGGYSAPSGTSFASPTTAGVVALIMGANGALSPDEVQVVLKNTADDLGDPGTDVYYGAGRINAAQAVALAADVSPGDTEPPTVSITSPGVGSTLSGLVDVNVLAQDAFGVSRVELFVNGSLAGTDTTPPYEFTWDSAVVANGSVSLFARAFDAANNEGQSNTVAAYVDNGSTNDEDTTPPTVTITSPVSGSTVSGTINLSAYASDDRAVTEVRIYVDGALKCAGGTNVTCGWNSRKYGTGSHTITATAKDQAGNTDSEDADVTVVSKGHKGGGNRKKSN
jgi:subtilisin family serine protease